jgi:hypothetical protein
MGIALALPIHGLTPSGYAGLALRWPRSINPNPAIDSRKDAKNAKKTES